MSDREEIVQLVNLYGLAMDTRRWDLFDRIFTPDCDADYGPTSHWTDRAAFKRDFGTFHELFPSWKEFWAARPDKDSLPQVAAPAPLEQFLKTIRRGTPAPKMRVR